MKKKITVLLITIFCIALMVPAASAANRVPEMEIEVALRPDGSAYITQTWTTDTDSGTEFYLALNDSGYLTVTDFSVSDENGPYTLNEDWDIDASFDDKAYKCGIVETGSGVELCWGLSEYGENRYTIEYVLHDLVSSYSDADGFNHRFVDEMSFFPSDVVLTICNQDGSPITNETCDIWAFGYEGQIVFEDGVIRAWSEAPLERGHHMTVMVSMEKGILTPLREVEDSFESVKDRAFEGSDYGDYEDEDVTFLDFLLYLIMPAAMFFGFIVLLVKIKKAKLNKRMKKADYFRDAPNNGNLNVTYQLGLCSDLCEEDALLGAYLLRLVSQGCLVSTSDAPDEENICLRLDHAPRSGNEYDDLLYMILEAAAGPDGVLDPHELANYCRVNYTPMFRFMDSCERNGKQALLKGACLKGAVLDDIKDLTPQGQKELDEILGLKHFLLDFSLIQERGVQETVIWQDYMVYALMLGIADKLAPQIRDLYPDQLPQLDQYQRYVRYTGYYNTLMYREYSTQRMQREAKKRSSGGGGRSSFGGGGGFSGGGGGGVR